MLRRFVLVTLAFILVTGLVSAVDVRLTDPVYHFLGRADILGYLDKPLPGAKPYSRIDVARHLIAAGAHRDEMTRIEREQLDEFLFELQDELRYLGTSADSDYRSFWEKWTSRPAWLFPNGLDMFHFNGGEDDDWQITLNPTAVAEYYERLPENVGDEKLTARVIGNGGAIRFRSGRWSASGAVADNHIVMHPAVVDSSRYPYIYSGPTGTNENLLDFYDSEASIAYQNEHVLAHFGKGRQRWGDGETGALLVNDSGLPYTHFRLVGTWGPFNYTIIQARLQTEPRVIQDTYPLPYGGFRELYAPKWLSAQRFEINFHRTFRCAFFEQVIYGERPFDVEYLNPLIFIQGQEHFTGDPDNMMLGGDIRWLAFNRTMLHVQVLLDEFVFSGFGSDDYTNKWAYLAGIKVVDLFNIHNSMLFVEYARIRPYVYTHKYLINRATHLGNNLGYPMPPNSDNMIIGWRQQVARGAAITVHTRVSRHGANPEGVVLGGDIYYSDHEDNAIRSSIPFLSGDKETQREVGIALEIEPIQHLHFDFNLRYIDRELLPEEGAGVKENDLLFQGVCRWYPVF